ncbi:MAG TPA: hypothetical protein VGF22_19415, partial [Acidimicrobiales bacterium]
MGPIAVEAVRIISAEPLSLSERLEPLVTAAAAAESRSAASWPTFFRFTPRLESAWRDVSDHRRGFVALIRSRAETRPNLVRLLPQLCWEELYVPIFTPLLGRLSARSGPAFVSLALAAAAGLGWLEAGVALGLGGRQGRALAGQGLQETARIGTREQFARAVNLLLEALAAAEDPVDYGLRRRLLAPNRLLGGSGWSRLCARAQVPKGRGRKRGLAQVWLWQYLTLADPLRASSISELGGADAYRRFCTRQLPQLKPALEVEAARLLYAHKLLG